MSRKELSCVLVGEGFSVVGVDGWKNGSVLISLDNGFLVVEHSDGGQLSFPFMEDEDFYIMVIDGDLVIWWNGMTFIHKI